MRNLIAQALSITSWVLIPLCELVTFMLLLIISAKFANSALLAVAVASATFSGFLLLALRYSSAKLQIGLGAVVIVGLLTWLAMDRLQENPTPKKPPDHKQLNYWQLATGSKIGFIKYEPTIPSAKPPILYLHGGPGVSTVFGYRFAEKLAESGFVVYAFDQAGSGFSGNLPLSQYSTQRSIEDIEAIRRELKVNQISLIGHSYGGTLAAAYLSKYDDRVSSAVLMAPSGYGEDGAGENPNRTDLQDGLPGMPEFHRISPKVYLAMILGGLGAKPAVIEDLISQQGSKKFVEQNLKVDRLVRALYCKERTPVDPYPDLKFLNMNIPASSMLSRSMAQFVDKSDLEDIQTPCLIVRGICDYIPTGSSKIYEEMMPHAEWIELDGFGHNILLEGAPLEVVVAFLNRK